MEYKSQKFNFFVLWKAGVVLLSEGHYKKLPLNGCGCSWQKQVETPCSNPVIKQIFFFFWKIKWISLLLKCQHDAGWAFKYTQTLKQFQGHWHYGNARSWKHMNRPWKVLSDHHFLYQQDNTRKTTKNREKRTRTRKKRRDRNVGRK